MRHLMALGILYVLVAALVLPTSLFAEETTVVEPEAAVTVPESTPAPAPEPAPAPAPTTTAPAPVPEAPAAPTTTAPEVQQLPDEEPAAAPAPKAKAAASQSVTIQNFAFGPATVTVNVGDTVTWTNQDDVGHSATASDGGFDTGILDQGQSGSATFNEAGTFAYFCTPHPNMQGTVVVQAAQTDSESTGDEASTGDTVGSSGTDTDDGPSLPSTGMDALALAVLGLLMLALGVGVRRRSAAESPQPAGRIGW